MQEDRPTFITEDDQGEGWDRPIEQEDLFLLLDQDQGRENDRLRRQAYERKLRAHHWRKQRRSR